MDRGDAVDVGGRDDREVGHAHRLLAARRLLDDRQLADARPVVAKALPHLRWAARRGAVRWGAGEWRRAKDASKAVAPPAQGEYHAVPRAISPAAPPLPPPSISGAPITRHDTPHDAPAAGSAS